MRIALGQFATARKWRAPVDRNVRVLAHEERFEAARFERTGQFADIDAVVGRKVKCANEHGSSLVSAKLKRNRVERRIRLAGHASFLVLVESGYSRHGQIA